MNAIRLRRGLAAVLAACFLSAAGAADSLRVAVLASRAAPFVIAPSQGGVAGLDLSVARLIADELGLLTVASLLPAARLRMAAAAGDFDLVCGLDPQRLSTLEGFDWSPALGETPELLLGHRGAEAVDQLDQVSRGAVVGTLLGHSYPVLADALADGRLRREDALGEDRLLRKLAAQRHPYAVLLAGTLQAERPRGIQGVENLASWRVVLGSQRYHCAVPATGRVPAERVWQALAARRTAVQALLVEALRGPLAVVVSQQSPLRALSEAELADLYLGRRSQLGDGLQPRLAMLRGPERRSFLAQLGTESADFNARWAALQFGGRSRPPVELADAQQMKARLRADPLLVGYLPLSLVDAQLRIVHLP